METSPDITAIDWDFIEETIQNEKCILFIGPEIFSAPGKENIETQLVQYLGIPDNPDIQTYYQHDGLFLFTSRARKTKTFYKIKSFYNQEFPYAEKIMEKIARIPFHFIIHMMPDHSLSKVFNKHSIKHDFEFYWKKHAPDPKIKTPTRNNPLIYNLLGNMDLQESMVLTHDDLFTYFESIFSGHSMPEKLKRIIKEADNFIFLGIPFAKWYMQLLLRILYIHNDFDFVRYAANQAVDEEIKTFCLEQFKIEFVPERIEEFVEELYERFEAKGALRTGAEEEVSPVEEFMEWLAQDKIEEIFTALMDFLENLGERGYDLLDSTILLSNKYSRLMKRSMQGIIREEEASVQSNKIRNDLLNLLHQVKELE